MFSLFGLGGKQRSKIGKWLDKRGITQEWMIMKSGVSRTTMTRVASDPSYQPSLTTIKKLMKVIKELEPTAHSDEFFNI